MSHPRLAELFLHGLIPDPSMRDALLGDLAEEWTDRVESGGVDRANRWYRLQTVRATPFLFLQWARETAWYAVLGMLSLGVMVRFATGLLGLGTMVVVAAALDYFGIDRWTATGLASLASAAWSFAGGMIVARVARRAPTPAIFWFTVTVYLTAIIMPAEQTLLAHWYLLSEKLLALLAAVAGGMVALARTRQRHTSLGGQPT